MRRLFSQRLFFFSALLFALTLPAIAQSAEPTAASPAATAMPHTIELYATQWCGYCQRVRMLLQQRNLSYTEIDIERSPEGLQRFQQMGGRGTPLLVVDGRVIRGYNEQAILDAIQ